MDVTYFYNYSLKKDISLGVFNIDYQVPSPFAIKIVNLPFCLIKDAYIYVNKVPDNPHTVTLATDEGITNILMRDAYIGSVGRVGTFTGEIDTVNTSSEVWAYTAGANNGKYVIYVEYVQYDRGTGIRTRTG